LRNGALGKPIIFEKSCGV